jgi:ABC-type lipoprotein export system ATPase subunit
MTVIELQNLCKTYHIGEIDIPVLRGVSLNVERGEFVALMGASGSGKTTLLNVIGCLDRPSSGSYKLDGQEVSTLSSNEQAALRNSKLGFVFQTFNLLPRTTALDNVLMPLAYRHEALAREETEQRATELLKRVGLGDRLEHEATQLSGGQNQRVAIARALINHPAILLADEPTGNLDSQASAEILAMLETLNREDGITLVLVTHDAEVASRAQRIIHIRDGKIEQDGYKNKPSSKQSEQRDRTEESRR